MDRQRARRSPARFLAPLALIAVVVVFLAIVSGSHNSGSGGGSNTTDATSNSATTGTKTTSSTKSKSKSKSTTTSSSSSGPSVYIVKVGDTLGAIATKTGVPLSKIQELNPAVDPHTMVAGQKIKLR